MTKFLLVILFLFPILTFAQLSPTTGGKITNATTNLGVNVSVGAIIFDKNTNKSYLVISPASSSDQISTAPTKFKEIPDMNNFSNILYVGTGRTYSTIQAAVTAASSGSLIKVANGTYTEVVTISGKNNITLEGEVKPRFSGSYTAGSISGGVILNGEISVDNSSGIIIRKFGINITAAHAFGINISGFNGAVSNIAISDVIVKGDLTLAEHGFLSENDGYIVSNVTFTDCQAYYTGYGFVTKSQNTTFTNCFAGKQLDFGFDAASDNIQLSTTIDFGKNISFINCVSDSATNYGFVCYTKDFFSSSATNMAGYELDNVQVTGCTSMNSAFGMGVGIYFAGTWPDLGGGAGERIVKNVIINGFYAKGNSGFGIYLFAASGIKISNVNYLSNSNDYGVGPQSSNIIYTDKIVGSQWTTNGSDVGFAGNVGIGTTAPGNNLHVLGGAFFDTYSNTTTAKSNVKFRKAAGTLSSPLKIATATSLGSFSWYGAYAVSSVGTFGSAATATINGVSEESFDDSGHQGTALTFETTPLASATKIERVRINSQGNVGIGMSAPVKTLDITGTFNVTGKSTLGDTATISTEFASGAKTFVTNTSSGLFLKAYNHFAAFNFAKIRGTYLTPSAILSGDTILSIGLRGYSTSLQVAKGAIRGYAAGDWGASSTPTYWSIWTTPIGSTTMGEVMRIRDDGRVGIGTTLPLTKLDVNGCARIGDTLYFGTGTTKRIYNTDGGFVSSSIFTAPNFVSTVATGTSPYACTSTTLNSNLNADMVDGYHSTSFALLSGATFTGGNTIVYDLMPTIPASNTTATGLIETDTANVTMAFGDVVFFGGTNSDRMVLAKADAIANCPYVAAICIASISAGSVGQYLTYGDIRNDSWTWTKGAQIYVSTTGTTTNTLTQTAPSSANNVILCVGVAKTAKVIKFQPNYIPIEHN